MSRRDKLTSEDLRASNQEYLTLSKGFQIKVCLSQISDFNGEYAFLNNEFPCDVRFEGERFPSVFCAFQAVRAGPSRWRSFAAARTSADVIELARGVADPPRWQESREKVMLALLRDKFVRNAGLGEQLAATRPLVFRPTFAEDSPANRFWGTVDGRGQNRLGELLGQVREEALNDSLVAFWLEDALSLAPSRGLPSVAAHFECNGQRFKPISVDKWIIGSAPNCDVPIEGLDARHCALAFDCVRGIVLVDLSSSVGTFVESERLPPFEFRRLAAFQRFRVGETEIGIEIECEATRRFARKRLELLAARHSACEALNITSEQLSERLSDGRTLFVARIHPRASPAELRRKLEERGRVEAVRGPPNASYALVTFGCAESARNVLEGRPIYLYGTKLLVRRGRADERKQINAFLSDKFK